MMGGTHYHTPQTIFQHMMVGQQNAQQESPQWMQIPQLPSISTPWSIQPSQPNVIQFGKDRAEQNYGLTLHQKRKLDPADAIETRQHKQFITEEKMAAHFRELHISSRSNVPTEPVPSASTTFESIIDKGTKVALSSDLNMDSRKILDLDSEYKRTPRLVMSEELKRLKHEPVLPSSLLSKLERPTMALVLWEPPNKHLRLMSGPRNTPTPIPSVTENDNNNDTSTANDQTNVVNNNNESIPNLNEMVTDVELPTLEPMDL